MAELQDISDKVDIAKLYLIQIVHDTRLTLQLGYGSLKDATALKRLIGALSFDIVADINDDTTLSLYKCLLKDLGDYGATYTVDPSVKIPGQTVIINQDGVPPITRNQGDLIYVSDEIGYYLPFVDDDGNPFTTGMVPVLVQVNGVGTSVTFDSTFFPARIYGFANNATQTIVVTIV